MSGERSYAFAPFPDPPEEGAAGKFRLMVGSMPQPFGLYSAYASHSNSLCPKGFVEMHPEDGGDLGLEENDEVILRSSIGEFQGPVCFSTGLLRCVVWVPKHFREMPVLRLLDEHTQGGWVHVISVREASKVVAQPRG